MQRALNHLRTSRPGEWDALRAASPSAQSARIPPNLPKSPFPSGRRSESDGGGGGEALLQVGGEAAVLVYERGERGDDRAHLVGGQDLIDATRRGADVAGIEQGVAIPA